MARHRKQLQEEFLKTMTQLATAGFGLVAALAWNSFVQDLIKRFIEPGSGLKGQLFYALTVTIIAVIITYSLGQLTQRASDQNDEK